MPIDIPKRFGIVCGERRNNMKTYTALARAIGARLRCLETGNDVWANRHEETAKELLESFPSGCGFDKGTKLDWDASTGEKLVFVTAFHHMNEGGMYDGWSDHTVAITPSFEVGYRIKVGGQDRNGIKEYIADSFHDCLNEDVAETIPA